MGKKLKGDWIEFQNPILKPLWIFNAHSDDFELKIVDKLDQFLSDGSRNYIWLDYLNILFIYFYDDGRRNQKCIYQHHKSLSTEDHAARKRQVSKRITSTCHTVSVLLWQKKKRLIVLVSFRSYSFGQCPYS